MIDSVYSQGKLNEMAKDAVRDEKKSWPKARLEHWSIRIVGHCVQLAVTIRLDSNTLTTNCIAL